MGEITDLVCEVFKVVYICALQAIASSIPIIAFYMIETKILFNFPIPPHINKIFLFARQ